MRILLVEDSADDAVLLQMALQDAGLPAPLERVETRAQLTTALADGPWDLMLCDNNLPDLDALAVIDLVREHGGGSLPFPIIVMSGHLELDGVVAAMRHGARDCIDKAALPRLIPVLEREMAHARTARSLRELQVLHGQRAIDGLRTLPDATALEQHLQTRLARPSPCALLLLQAERSGWDKLRMRDPAGWRAWLQHTSERLQRACGGNDFLAWLEDGIFALVCDDDGDAARLAARADTLRRQFQQGVPHGDQEIAIGCHIGASRSSDAAHNLRPAAATALHSAPARQTGYCLHTPDLDLGEQRRRRIGHALQYALERSEFALHYQPQINPADGRIHAAEALLRWQSPTLGAVSPMEFIPQLEESGRIVEVSRWVLMEACRQVADWDAAGLPPIDIAVNIPAQLFGHHSLVEMVSHALSVSGLAPQRLELEITEGTAVQDRHAALDIMARIRHLGVRIAMDDFGVGYSSLGYLKHLPLDTLKIDRLFVTDLEHSEVDRNLVRAILTMGRSLGLQIIAEGIETAAQRDFLASTGCDLLQGYYFSRPLAATLFEEALGQDCRSDGEKRRA